MMGSGQRRGGVALRAVAGAESRMTHELYRAESKKHVGPHTTRVGIPFAKAAASGQWLGSGQRRAESSEAMRYPVDTPSASVPIASPPSDIARRTVQPLPSECPMLAHWAAH